VVKQTIYIYIYILCMYIFQGSRDAQSVVTLQRMRTCPIFDLMSIWCRMDHHNHRFCPLGFGMRLIPLELGDRAIPPTGDWAEYLEIGLDSGMGRPDVRFDVIPDALGLNDAVSLVATSRTGAGSDLRNCFLGVAEVGRSMAGSFCLVEACLGLALLAGNDLRGDLATSLALRCRGFGLRELAGHP
jgi:hypothetical protein